MKIGILTGGGDVPGLNPCIRSITLSADDNGWEVVGFKRGWQGVLEIDPADPASVAANSLPLTRDGVRGIDAYRASWPPFFEWQRTGARFDLVDLVVEAGAEVAFAWALLRCGTPDELQAEPDRRLRLTIGLRRDGGRWVVAHEHHSFTDRS